MGVNFALSGRRPAATSRRTHTRTEHAAKERRHGTGRHDDPADVRRLRGHAAHLALLRGQGAAVPDQGGHAAPVHPPRPRAADAHPARQALRILAGGDPSASRSLRRRSRAHDPAPGGLRDRAGAARGAGRAARAARRRHRRAARAARARREAAPLRPASSSPPPERPDPAPGGPMPLYDAPVRDMQFVLHDVLDVSDPGHPRLRRSRPRLHRGGARGGRQARHRGAGPPQPGRRRAGVHAGERRGAHARRVPGGLRHHARGRLDRPRRGPRNTAGRGCPTS